MVILQPLFKRTDLSTIFLTGGTGFLGSYILQNLVQQGFAVRALRRSGKLPFGLPDDMAGKVEWVDGDVLDVTVLADAVQGVDAVIHSAAVVSFRKADREAMSTVNVEGTANVVNAALERGVPRLVHVSSVAALGRMAKDEVATEDRRWPDNKGQTHYGITKHGAEIEVWRGFAEGLQGVIVNPSTILGFGNWHQSSCAIFKNAYDQKPWYTTGINGFVGVEDVAAATVQLMLSNINEQRFIVSAQNISFQDLLNEMADSMGRKRPRLKATPLLAGLAWRAEGLKSLFTGKPPLLTAETARMAQSRTRFDGSRLLAALPHFKYTPVPEVIATAGAQYVQALKDGRLTL